MPRASRAGKKLGPARLGSSRQGCGSRTGLPVGLHSAKPGPGVPGSTEVTSARFRLRAALCGLHGGARDIIYTRCQNCNLAHQSQLIPVFHSVSSTQSWLWDVAGPPSAGSDNLDNMCSVLSLSICLDKSKARDLAWLAHKPVPAKLAGGLEACTRRNRAWMGSIWAGS